MTTAPNVPLKFRPRVFSLSPKGRQVLMGVWRRVAPIQEWWLSPPDDLEKALELFHNWEGEYHKDTRQGLAVRDLGDWIEEKGNEVLADARRQNPFAFVEFSYEQALKANAWVWGITYLCDFDANRKGKALKNGTKVLTPEGTRHIENLKVGDKVLDGRGQPVEVRGVYPQGVLPLFKLTFNDGSSFKCCAEHLHQVAEPRARFRPNSDFAQMGPSILSTQTLIEKYGLYPKPTLRCAWPQTPPAHFQANELSINPYLLGLLLGDGCFRRDWPMFTTADSELLGSIQQLAPEDTVLRFKDRYDWDIRSEILRANLIELNLWNKLSIDKEIPLQYRHGSLEQRLALLQGLFDSDGSACKNTGASMFYSSSKILAKQVLEMLRSIGCLATMQDKYTKCLGRKMLSYVVYVRFSPQCLFRLARKKAKAEKKKNRWQPTKLLVSIEPVESAEATCIEVSGPFSLFLIEQGIVTHNTAGAIFNALLWILPNDPNWHCFKRHADDWGREVEVLRRPTTKAVLEIQKYIELNPELAGDPKQQPWEGDNLNRFNELKRALPHCFRPCFPLPSVNDRRMTGWQGAPDSKYHKEIVMPEWRKWLPREVLITDSEYDGKMVLEVKYQHPTTKSIMTCRIEILFKSYDAKEEKFSGAAVKFIVLTEGVKQGHFNEIKQRFQEDAFASWDYTPYESRNVGAKSALAHKVFKGKEQLPLCPYVFTGFGISKTPTYILPESKRKDLIRMWAGKPEGTARIDGNFFSSSPVILSNLDTDLHCVPWTKKELFERFPDGRLYRGLDPGWDHPTSCTWALLTRFNTWFIYRNWSQAGVSVGNRCNKIIELSGNTRREVKWGRGEEDVYYEEVQINDESECIVSTFADYHVFETDQQTERPYSSNYIKEGLIIQRSVTYSPKARGQRFDQLLEPSLVRAHPISRKPPGAKIYFLINEPGVAEAVEMLENLFWARYSTGDNKGEPKDEMQDHGDDEFDSASYLVCSPAVWTSHVPKRRIASDIELDIHKVNSFRNPRFASTGY